MKTRVGQTQAVTNDITPLKEQLKFLARNVGFVEQRPTVGKEVGKALGGD